jgi:hypothetical protein
MAPDGFIGAGLALLGRVVFDWLKDRGGRKNGNGSAGAKPPEYWEKRYDKLDNAMVALTQDVEDIKEMLTTLIRRRKS